MALTYTPQAKLGEACPNFELPSVDGKTYCLDDFKDKKALVVMFICGHCPYVQAIEERYVKLAKEFQDSSVQFVGICSNDAKDYPEDTPEALLQRTKDKGYNFPYLIDESQQVAKDFKAVCTPDIFVYDQGRKLYYRGRFDDSWKDKSQVEVQELKNALTSLLENKPAPEDQVPSMGCSIKWK